MVGRLSAINKHISRTFDETLARHGLNHGEYRLLLRLATRSEDNRMMPASSAALCCCPRER